MTLHLLRINIMLLIAFLVVVNNSLYKYCVYFCLRETKFTKIVPLSAADIPNFRRKPGTGGPKQGPSQELGGQLVTLVKGRIVNNQLKDYK